MLSIQKHILLLNDFYYAEFSSHLEEKKAELPLRLVKTIRAAEWNQPDSEELCSLVYGNADEKSRRKFLQLTHHTFKLSSFLSRNYPSYLKTNLVLIEQLINSGEVQRANTIAEFLADITEKTEDFSTQIGVLKFFAQQAFITESKDSTKFHKQIDELISLERQQNEIYSYLREYLHYKKKENLTLSKQEQHFEFFDPYINSRFYTISIIARFGKYFELSFLSQGRFYHESTFEELEKIERDIYNNGFLIFPFLDDVLFRVLGLKLQWLVNKMDTDGMMKESLRVIQESSQIRFWTSYVNIPELFAIAIQCSHYLSHFGETFREDFYQSLPADIKERVNFLKIKLKQELAKPIWNDGYIIKLINTRSFYSGLLLLGTPEEIQEAIDLIEETLITYQQIPFQKFLDGMFAGLLIGYFSLKNHKKVADSYKRYKKATAGNIVLEENDLTIAVYYYCSQWIETGRKQYAEKLEGVLAACASKSNLKHVENLTRNICAYFSVPVK